MAFTVRLNMLHVLNSIDNDAGVADIGQGFSEGAAWVIIS